MTEEAYREYLQSNHWKITRTAALERAGHRCQVCNSVHALDVHHRTYERIGCEKSEDLTVLCGECHTMFHERTKQPPPVSKLDSALNDAFVALDSQFSDVNGAVRVNGIPTGWIDLDHVLSGLQPGALLAVAARAGGGKSSFLGDLARRLAVDGKQKTLLVSLESNQLDLGRQLLASQGKVDALRIRRAHLSSETIQQLMTATDVLRAASVFLCTPPKLTLMQLAACVREYCTQQKVEVVLIDCLDMIEPENPRDIRQEQIATISRRLKCLAKELNVPFVVSVRLSRNHEDAHDRRPTPADLKQNWPIEHEADTLLLLHRPYLFSGTMEDNVMEVIVAKQRNGPTCEVTLTYLKQFNRFESYIADAGYGEDGR